MIAEQPAPGPYYTVMDDQNECIVYKPRKDKRLSAIDTDKVLVQALDECLSEFSQQLKIDLSVMAEDEPTAAAQLCSAFLQAVNTLRDEPVPEQYKNESCVLFAPFDDLYYAVRNDTSAEQSTAMEEAMGQALVGCMRWAHFKNVPTAHVLLDELQKFNDFRFKLFPERCAWDYGKAVTEQEDMLSSLVKAIGSSQAAHDVPNLAAYAVRVVEQRSGVGDGFWLLP